MRILGFCMFSHCTEKMVKPIGSVGEVPSRQIGRAVKAANT